MNKVLNSVYNRLFPSIVISALIAFAIPLAALFDGISKRYISHNLVPYDVGQDEIGQLLFLYVDKGIVDTGFTIAFWAIVATVGVFAVWVLINTYNGISNILIIDAAYSNKKENYIWSVIKLSLAKAAVSLFGVVGILMAIKYLIPGLLRLIGKNLLSEQMTLQTVALTFIWYLVLVAVLELMWLAATYMTRFIKS